MDKISDLALKSQTVCGAVHFVLFLVSWPTIIGLLKSLHGTDRLNFNCTPKPGDVTRQLCYNDYISTVSPFLIPLNFALIICGILGFFWVVFILYSVIALRRINKEQDSNEKECLSKQFMWRFLFHICIQLAVLGVMMGLFCGNQTIHLPLVYMCSQGNTTQIATNQVNMTCNDLHLRQKSRLNIGIVTIMAISIVLCIVSIIHLFLTRKDFLQQLLGDQESDNPEAIPLAQTSEQDAMDMNRELELDQYEVHDTWLEIVKQYGYSECLFSWLLNEAQTADQEQKRLKLFLARFRDHFHVDSWCAGCGVELSGLSDRRYRCLNCTDVEFCYNCYTKRVIPEDHAENHEVIEMRFKCADCKGFILGTQFCCYKCPDFFLCVKCHSSHPAAHKVAKFSVNKEPFVEECQEQLHSHYNTFSKVKIIPWERASSIHIDDIYTQLSWVKDDRKPSGVTQEELKDYTDIFKGDEHHLNPKRLLVYGRPGIGKSTFSKKTAFDWSNQRKAILMKFDVVLLIKLRDVCNLLNIHDVLKASRLLAGDGVVSINGVYEYMLCNQEKVLLILDGYDEYVCTAEQSPVRDIWAGTLLRNIHVIITTRHEKTDELREPSHAQFKINGFKSDDQVRAFAKKFGLSDEDVNEFVSYLHEKDLKHMAEIPLLLLMLCLVWKQNHPIELPKSRADIYTKFLETLLHHADEKDAKLKEFRKIDGYKEELCTLGKLAFDALLEGNLSFPLSKLPDDFLSTKFIGVGLFHVLNVSSVVPEQAVYFIHKSVQEYLASFCLKEELLKETSTTCLSQVDSFEKIVKMIEVLRFACELSTDAAWAILSHLETVGKKEGLTEYNFTEKPCIEDLSNHQKQLLTLISHSFFACSAEKRRDPMSLSCVGDVLLIDPDQLHSVANEHFLKPVAAPNFIFFADGEFPLKGYQLQDLISVLEDLSAVVVSCSGEKKASDLLKKYSFQNVHGVFLRKEKGNMYLYFAHFAALPAEMLRELVSSPESTQKKKPVDDQSNGQDDSSALCLTENSTADTQATQHCLSCVWRIIVFNRQREEIETLIDVLPFLPFPREIFFVFSGVPAAYSDPVLAEKLVSRINFTNRLKCLILPRIGLTAKPAAVITRNLYQTPNLSWLDLSGNPLGEGVSDLTRHLSHAPNLETLDLHGVEMTKEQVNDLAEAVRQTKISEFSSSYHDEKGNPKPEDKWPSKSFWGRWVIPETSLYHQL